MNEIINKCVDKVLHCYKNKHVISEYKIYNMIHEILKNTTDDVSCLLLYINLFLKNSTDTYHEQGKSTKNLTNTEKKEVNKMLLNVFN